MKTMKILAMFLALGLSGMLFAQASSAAVTAEEAKQLGTTLTKFGAEKAGNKDGSIPAYTGGLDGKDVPGLLERKPERYYIDPFEDEKVLYSVSAKNMQEYADMLTEGDKDLMRTHPDYRIDVHPTHRTMRYPDWVIENTLKNATTVQMAGEVEGDAVMGADKDNKPFPGIPFPIPKNGYEVMWNHKMYFGPAVNLFNHGYSWMADTAGNIIRLPGNHVWQLKPWYDTSGRLRPISEDALTGNSLLLLDPPSQAGVVFLLYYLSNAEHGGQNTWFYSPGQRRVRRAPEFAYDVPVAAFAGIYNWDEPFGFVGRMDRFDFKLVGKKEMLVPYNVFGMTNTMDRREYIGPKFIKPEGMRHEKHRVWVVDAARKSGVRHTNSRKVFYIDEDSWAILSYEGYDDAGNIWRFMKMQTYPCYDLSGGFEGWHQVIYDLIKGNYAAVNTTDIAPKDDPAYTVENWESSEGLDIPLTPAAVAAGSVR